MPREAKPNPIRLTCWATIRDGQPCLWPGETRAGVKLCADPDERIARVEVREVVKAKRKGKR